LRTLVNAVQGCLERVRFLEGFDVIGARHEAARHDRRRQERGERDPVLNAGDRKCVERRQKEKVVASRGDDRADKAGPRSAVNRDAEDGEDVEEAGGRSVLIERQTDRSEHRNQQQ